MTRRALVHREPDGSKSPACIIALGLGMEPLVKHLSHDRVVQMEAKAEDANVWVAPANIIEAAFDESVFARAVAVLDDALIGQHLERRAARAQGPWVGKVLFGLAEAWSQ